MAPGPSHAGQFLTSTRLQRSGKAAALRDDTRHTPLSAASSNLPCVPGHAEGTADYAMRAQLLP